MCSYAIRYHKISYVVVGIATGEIGEYSSKYLLLLDKEITKWGSPPEIINGVLEKECSELHK